MVAVDIQRKFIDCHQLEMPEYLIAFGERGNITSPNLYE